MINQEKINSYLNSLIYTFSRPRFRDVVLSAVNISSLQKAGTEAKFISLGALIGAEKFDEFSELVELIDFDDVPFEDRTHLANCIFNIFSGNVLSNSIVSAPLAAALTQLLSRLAPDAVLAHKLNHGSLNKATLIDFNYAKNINTSVSGVVFFREFLYGPGSRKHEFGHRIQSSLASQGWDVSLLTLDELSQYSTPNKLDFALLDILAFWQKPPLDHICSTLLHLKRFFRKIIIIEPDPWTGLYDDMLRAISDHVDYIWGFLADWSLTNDPCYKEKSILFPNVGGFDHLPYNKQIGLDWDECTFNFTGSVQGYNLNRVYWILELISRKLPIKVNITQPGVDDGLDRESSLQLYAQTLASTHASLNMTTRKDGSRIVTARSVEVISLNRLLIQERCPGFQYYYVEGEHFLEFSDIENLCVIIDFLRSHPKVAQRICSQGYQFYKDRYSSRKLVEHFQTLI